MPSLACTLNDVLAVTVDRVVLPHAVGDKTGGKDVGESGDCFLQRAHGLRIT